MTLKHLVFAFCFGFVLSGCSSEKHPSIESIGNIQKEPEQNPKMIEDFSEEEKEILTAEAVEQLAAKHAELAIEDFGPYLDLSPLQEEGSLWETLEFDYEGQTLCLRVSASDKELAAAPYEGALDGAVVFREDFLELDSAEEEYAYDGSCADIRSGNLEHILDGNVEMSDYLTVTLPEGLRLSGFKYWMGSHGGAAFLREGEAEEELTLENAGFYAEKPLAGGIEILGNGEIEQGTSVVKELTPLETGEWGKDGLILRREIRQTDSGTVWYIARTEREGSCISYCLYLSEEEYTEEVFLEVSETLCLMENAVY